MFSDFNFKLTYIRFVRRKFRERKKLQIKNVQSVLFMKMNLTSDSKLVNLFNLYSKIPELGTTEKYDLLDFDIHLMRER